MPVMPHCSIKEKTVDDLLNLVTPVIVEKIYRHEIWRDLRLYQGENFDEIEI